jgi:hypothetical protein
MPHLHTLHLGLSPQSCFRSIHWKQAGLYVPPNLDVNDDDDGDDNDKWLSVLKIWRAARHTVSLVLNAAAACPIFGPRSVRAHYLQPPAQLGFTLSQRSLEFASMQLWCFDNNQRVQLLCCCCPLSVLALRLARAVNRCEGSHSFEQRAIASIMKRCFSIVALRFFAIGSE